MKRINLAGQTFGYWTVQKDRIHDKNIWKWLCQCRCGTQKYVNEHNLTSGRSRSCGCLPRMLSKNQINGLIDGTGLNLAERKTRNDNTSGHTGVYRLKNGRFRAGIKFKGKQYSLGNYPTFDDAVQARKRAEKTLHLSFLEEYERLQNGGDHAAAPLDLGGIQPNASDLRLAAQEKLDRPFARLIRAIASSSPSEQL